MEASDMTDYRSGADRSVAGECCNKFEIPLILRPGKALNHIRFQVKKGILASLSSANRQPEGRTAEKCGVMMKRRYNPFFSFYNSRYQLIGNANTLAKRKQSTRKEQTETNEQTQNKNEQPPTTSAIHFIIHPSPALTNTQDPPTHILPSSLLPSFHHHHHHHLLPSSSPPNPRPRIRLIILDPRPLHSRRPITHRRTYRYRRHQRSNRHHQPRPSVRIRDRRVRAWGE